MTYLAVRINIMNKHYHNQHMSLYFILMIEYFNSQQINILIGLI